MDKVGISPVAIVSPIRYTCPRACKSSDGRETHGTEGGVGVDGSEAKWLHPHRTPFARVDWKSFGRLTPARSTIHSLDEWVGFSVEIARLLIKWNTAHRRPSNR
ncbi:hypothetical protein J6590_053168 [Homalodisca vitripennis]|nr:hypothetical protein J6590_053168 [Homalodisca vitripennis]